MNNQTNVAFAWVITTGPRISKIYSIKPKDKAHYKIVHSRYKSEDQRVDFPFSFEVMIVPVADISESYPMFMCAVNKSVSIIDNENA